MNDSKDMADPTDGEQMFDAVQIMLHAIADLKDNRDIEALAMLVQIQLRIRYPGRTMQVLKRFGDWLLRTYARQRHRVMVLRCLEHFVANREAAPMTDDEARRYIAEIVSINTPAGQEEVDKVLDEHLVHLRLCRERDEEELALVQERLSSYKVAEQEILAARSPSHTMWEPPSPP